MLVENDRWSQERRNIAGDMSQAFIRKSADVAPRIESYLPRGFSVDQLRKDITLIDTLQPIAFAISRLAEKLSDTQALVSSEALTASLALLWPGGR